MPPFAKDEAPSMPSEPTAVGYEWVFAVTPTNEPPPAPSNDWGFDAPLAPWFDAYPGLDSVNRWGWVCRREFAGTPAPFAPVAGQWGKVLRYENKEHTPCDPRDDRRRQGLIR